MQSTTSKDIALPFVLSVRHCLCDIDGGRENLLNFRVYIFPHKGQGRVHYLRRDGLGGSFIVDEAQGNKSGEQDNTKQDDEPVFF